MSREQVTLTVTVTGLGPYRGAEFGLQDKKGELDTGTTTSAGAREFRCTATVRTGADGTGPPGGPFVHGKPGDRFLYISFRDASGGWARRTKIALPDALDPAAGSFTAQVRDVGTPWTRVEQDWSGDSGR